MGVGGRGGSAGCGGSERKRKEEEEEVVVAVVRGCMGKVGEGKGWRNTRTRSRQLQASLGDAIVVHS